MPLLTPTRSLLIIALFAACALAGCTKKAELGTEARPVKIFLTPSLESRVIEAKAQVFKNFIGKFTNARLDLAIPSSALAVMEAFANDRVDVAALNTFGYLKVHERYGARAALMVIRHGQSTYQSQFIVRADRKIERLEDLSGKKIAFVDPGSTAGYLLPMKTLNERGIKPKESVFAMKHDGVVTMVYQGVVDAGATFYVPPMGKKIEDARKLVLARYPDVEKKIKILELSKPIPNDPIVFSKEMSEDLRKKMADGFVAFSGTPGGRDILKELFSVEQLKKCSDEDYDEVRTMLLSVGTSVDEMLKK